MWFPIVRIVLTKLSDKDHRLEVVRSDGSRDSIELVTREALFHDFVHFAVEAEMPTHGGFWGALASGRSFADLNDRTGAATRDVAESLYAAEGAVGIVTGVMDMPVDQAVERLRWCYESMDQAVPEWCNEDFVVAVRERMRRLQGHWKATHFGQSMEIEWNDDVPD
jgi:hypothetical protein